MKEEYFKTKYEEISELSNTSKCRTVLMKNIDTAELVVKKEMPKEMLDVYSKLSCINDENVGIVKVYSCFEDEGKCVEIEEYVNGKTLESVMSDSKYGEEDYADIVISICDTLAVLHKMGIIHRDIHPKNIILDYNKVKLIDFDIARNKKENTDKDTRLLGTPEYASPEAYGFSQTDERSDIFSLGKLIEQLLDNNKFKHVIDKATEIDPVNRYQSAIELKQDLLMIAEGEQEIKKKSFIETVPGFRTNKITHKVIAIFLYFITFLIMTGTALQAEGNIGVKILSVVLFYVWLIIPYALLMNIGNISNYLVRAKYKDNKTKWLVRIMLCVFSFIITSIVLGIFLSTQP